MREQKLHRKWKILITSIVWQFAAVMAIGILFSCSGNPPEPISGDTEKIFPITAIDGATIKYLRGRDTITVRSAGLLVYDVVNGTLLRSQAQSSGIDTVRALQLGQEARRIARQYLVGKIVRVSSAENSPPIDVDGVNLRLLEVSVNGELVNYNAFVPDTLLR